MSIPKQKGTQGSYRSWILNALNQEAVAHTFEISLGEILHLCFPARMQNFYGFGD